MTKSCASATDEPLFGNSSPLDVIVKIDMMPDGTGDGWLTIVMRPHVTTANQRCDVAVDYPANILTQPPLIEPCDPCPAQRTTGKQLMCRVKD